VERRYDGHLGRFDYSLHAQAFDPLYLWHGFIMQPTDIAHYLSHRPEFYQLLDVWQVLSPQMLTHSSIHPVALSTLKLRIADVTKEMDLWSAFHKSNPSLWAQ
jgi:hypothetical protein